MRAMQAACWHSEAGSLLGEQRVLASRMSMTTRRTLLNPRVCRPVQRRILPAGEGGAR